jgi:hypothetical protein
LRFARSNALMRAGSGSPSKIPKGLQGDEVEPERACEFAHVLGPAIEIGEIVLEQLDARQRPRRRACRLK